MRNKLSDLNNHLFEVIEMLKNNSDPKASPNEKIDIQTAQQITETAKVIVDGFKIKTQAMHILSKAENMNAVLNAFNESGITDKKSIGDE